jgi:hypothetical protein
MDLLIVEVELETFTSSSSAEVEKLNVEALHYPNLRSLHCGKSLPRLRTRMKMWHIHTTPTLAPGDDDVGDECWLICSLIRFTRVTCKITSTKLFLNIHP